MKKFHIALATDDIKATVADYTVRLGCRPCVVVPNEYALWRTLGVNLSIRRDRSCKPGELRHLGWEDPAAVEFTQSQDIHGVSWESFTAQQQASEIEDAWPGTGYVADDE